MAKQKATTKRKKFRDLKLVGEIKGVRNRLQLSQRALAELLGVNQVQVTAWEKGGEQPSTEKLQKLAMLSGLTANERLAFWHRAVPNLEELFEFLKAQEALRLPPQTSPGVVIVDLLDGFYIDPEGRSWPLAEEESQIAISAKLFLNPTSIVCVKVQNSQPEISVLPPDPLWPGDIAIVDQSDLELEGLGDAEPAQGARLRAVLFPHIPEKLELRFTESELTRLMSLKADMSHIRRRMMLQEKFAPSDPGEQKAAENAAWSSVAAKMNKAILLYGWVARQRADDAWGESVLKKQDRRWRLFFFLDRERRKGIPLSEWMDDERETAAARVPLLDGAQIYGSVVGWIAAPQKRSGDTAENSGKT